MDKALTLQEMQTAPYYSYDLRKFNMDKALTPEEILRVRDMAAARDWLFKLTWSWTNTERRNDYPCHTCNKSFHSFYRWQKHFGSYAHIIIAYHTTYPRLKRAITVLRVIKALEGEEI